MNGQDPRALIERAKHLQSRRENAAAAAAYVEAGLAYLFDHADSGSARQAFTTAYTLDPQNLDVIFNLGRVDVLDGRVQEGLAKFIDVLRKSGVQHMPALFEAGCVYESMNQHDQAMLAFKRILDRDPLNIDATVHMGNLAEARGARNEAIGYYLQATAIAREMRRFATARRLADAVLAIDPRNPKARYVINDLDEQGFTEDETRPIAVKDDTSRTITHLEAPPRPMESGEQSRPAQVEAYTGRPADVRAPEQQAYAQAASATSAEMDARRAGLSAEVERLTKEKAALEAALAQERAMIESALRRKSQLNTEIAQAQSNLVKREAEIAAEAQAKHAEAEAQVEEARQALTDVQAHVAAAKAELESVREERQHVEHSIEQLRGDAAAATQAKQDHQDASDAEARQAQAELADLAEQLQESRKQLEEQSHEHVEAKAEFERNVAVWENTISRLRDEIEQLEARRAKLLKSRA